jgi:hypothetical protein
MLMTFGNTTIGTVDDTPNNDAKFAYPVTVTNAGLLIKASGYLSGLGAGVGNQPMKVVLYSDVSNAPNTLIASSSEVIVLDNTAYQWYDFWFTTPVRVTNTVYWLGYHAGTPNGGCQVKENSGNSFKYQNVNLDTYSDGPETTWTTVSGTAAGTITLNLTLDDEATYIASLGRRPVPMIQGPDRDKIHRLWTL